MQPRVGTEPSRDPGRDPGREQAAPSAGRSGVRAEPELPRELAEARELAARLESRISLEARARTELVHLVSHELRTPITVLSGFARLLQNEVAGPLNPEQQRFVAECLKACRRLDRFVDDLLAAGPEGAAPFVVAPARADLHETIEGRLESLAPLIEERGLKVEASLRCEDPWLDFDARRIEQVITNLMTNAIRYARTAGVIRLSTRSVEEITGPKSAAFVSSGPGVEVSVEDDGPGIPEADRERLFEPYVRGEARGDRAPEGGVAHPSGLGIGLAICRRLVDAHGGRIRAEPGELGGARFVFSLPRSGGAGRGDRP